jgi:RimJ/RimL family protein N-acetyltransferase
MEINIAIAPEWRGRGLGTILIKEGVSNILRDFPKIRTILALIKSDNTASKKTFQKCGFTYQETEPVKDDMLAERWILTIK